MSTTKRACDRCRRLKRRCEFSPSSAIAVFDTEKLLGDGGQICGPCSVKNILCHYEETAAIRSVSDIQRGSYTRAYVESLELRLKNAEEELRQPGQHLVSGIIKRLIKPLTPPHPRDSGPHDIAASFQALFLDDPPPDPGFQGESSAAMMVKAAVAIKPDRPATRGRRTSAPNPWIFKPWDPHSTALHHLNFPDPHLLKSLISLYFTHVNLFIPVLHRPLFEDDVSNQLHTRRADFAATLLLACALGCLYLPDSTVTSQDRVKLAWTWYDQVELCGHSLHRQPTTYDLQAYCLASQFLIYSSNPRLSWTVVGFGLRIAQDIGALRRNIMAPIATEEELEKRATWRVDTNLSILILLDVQLACALGRLTTLNPFDLDIGLPSEFDDEGWQPGHEPGHTPSTIAFFNCAIGLYRILHFLLKNFYSTSRLYTASRIHDFHALAAELDVTLSKWFSSIPQHLIWDPQGPDGPFFAQSAALYCFYHYTKMLLHRPFMLTMGVTDLRALRICTREAYACINVANIHRHRRPNSPLFFSQEPIFTAAMVLMLNMWRYPQHVDEQAQNLVHIQTVLDIFKSQQPHWSSAGFFITVLERLLALEYTSEQVDVGARDSDLYTGTPVEGLGAPADEPQPWITLAQAWLAGAVLDQNSMSDTLATLPPVFAGDDQDVGTVALHRLRALRGLKEAVISQALGRYGIGCVTTAMPQNPRHSENYDNSLEDIWSEGGW
ncbi:fungal-specific transcription factor domain-containing protein [Mycena galopus ATCC 62051]|nr:fungal-specific transcription factor domain-containing protein [Mycena galopus ATCC 62051]